MAKKKSDVLEDILHEDKVFVAVRGIRDHSVTISQVLYRAADEIERLRKENRALRIQLGKY